MLPRPLLGIALTALLLSAGAGAILAQDGTCGSRSPDRGHACLRANDTSRPPAGVVPPASVRPVAATSRTPAPVLAPAGSPLAVLAVGAAAAALAALVGAGLVVKHRLVAGGAALRRRLSSIVSLT
jgi:hypothetical protein